MLISIDGAGKNQLSHVWGYSSVVTLLFGKKSLIKTDHCVVALL
jgi:hypothetical protein